MGIGYLRRSRVRLLAATATAAGAALLAAHPSPAASPTASGQAAMVDASNLRLAAAAVQEQALRAGAAHHRLGSRRPAVVLLRSVEALMAKARAADPALRPRDTRPVMGPVPYNLSHRVLHPPGHLAIRATHTMRRFTHGVRIAGSAGNGAARPYHHVMPASFQRADGVYVDPRLPRLAHPTVGIVAVRWALTRLGQPYVWAAAGPGTFDCSGLVRWAYARAGIVLTHYTGSQWNEGRLIPPRDALPGDLVLYGHRIHHVGIYLAAGWMVNAPFTGHYVDVVPVEPHVTGLVRP